MATQPTLAGYTLPHPAAEDGFKIKQEYRGGRRIMADGSTVTDLVRIDPKHRFTLFWRGLLPGQMVNIVNAFAAIKDTPGTFLSPSNSVYTVSIDPSSSELEIDTRLVAGGVMVYDVTMYLREE